MHRKKPGIRTLVVAFGLGVVMAAESAQATDPLIRWISYPIHETPGDLQSPVLWRVTLEVEEADSDAARIGWRINQATIRQYGQGGQPDTVWVEGLPAVKTSDGLWWVDHANVANPQLAEFDATPSLGGLAVAEDPAQPDLKWEFNGDVYTPPPVGPPFSGPITAATYSFTRVGQSADEEGDDEPVPIDDPRDPPGSG